MFRFEILDYLTSGIKKQEDIIEAGLLFQNILTQPSCHPEARRISIVIVNSI